MSRGWWRFCACVCYLIAGFIYVTDLIFGFKGEIWSQAFDAFCYLLIGYLCHEEGNRSQP